MHELHWGLPVIGYLFLAGLGAGALTVSATMVLRSGGTSGESFRLARYGALLAPLPLILGTGLIVFELGTFQAALATGDFGLFFRWINLFLTVNLSPMSLGSWVLALCIVASLIYAYTFLADGDAPDGAMAGLRRSLAWIGVPLGIAVAIYTGVLLGATPARPFWNTPMLAFLFLFSAMSTGIASILLVKALFGKGGAGEGATDTGGYVLTASDAVFIGLELLAVILFVMFAQLSVGNAGAAISVILPGGQYATLFWGVVVLLGLLIPAVIELKYVIPTLRNNVAYAMPRGIEILLCAVILLGGFVLRYVVVIAGQVTGPVGL